MCMGIVHRNRFPDGVGNQPTNLQAISGLGVPPAPGWRMGDLGRFRTGIPTNIRTWTTFNNFPRPHPFGTAYAICDTLKPYLLDIYISYLIS